MRIMYVDRLLRQINFRRGLKDEIGMQIPPLEVIVNIKVDILYADLKFEGLFVVRVTFSVELSSTNHVKITKPKLNRV